MVKISIPELLTWSRMLDNKLISKEEKRNLECTNHNCSNLLVLQLKLSLPLMICSSASTRFKLQFVRKPLIAPYGLKYSARIGNHLKNSGDKKPEDREVQPLILYQRKKGINVYFHKTIHPFCNILSIKMPHQILHHLISKKTSLTMSSLIKVPQ